MQRLELRCQKTFSHGIKNIVGNWNLVDDKSLLDNTFLDKVIKDLYNFLMLNDVVDSLPKRSHPSYQPITSSG